MSASTIGEIGLGAGSEHRFECLFTADDLEAGAGKGSGDAGGIVVRDEQDSGSFHRCPLVR